LVAPGRRQTRYSRGAVPVYAGDVDVPTVVLSVRVRRELKEEAERLGIDIRRVVEEALEEAVRRARRERLRRLVEAARRASSLTFEEWAESVKEDRLSR